MSLPLPDRLRDPLQAFVEPRWEAGPEWSWTLPDQWHVTLAFLADVDPGTEEPLLEALAEVAARRDAFTFTLARAGTFPHPDAAKVLHLGPVEPVAELDRLAKAVRTACQSVGARHDGRPFTAHLTLARARRPVSATRWLRVFDAWRSEPWQVTGFDLVSSQWAGPGSRSVHRVVERFAFLPSSGSPSSRH
ncbi:RNA 2',3'-cyclic phosphodiesterase [Propionibacteriaceae bacterium Y2011]